MVVHNGCGVFHSGLFWKRQRKARNRSHTNYEYELVHKRTETTCSLANSDHAFHIDATHNVFAARTNSRSQSSREQEVTLA